MLATGLDVAEAGIVLTVASAIAAVVNAIIGRVLDRAESVVFIAVISLVEGVAYLVYMYGFLASIVLLIVVAAVIERLARGFYPVFAVYEYDVYPEEIREKGFRPTQPGSVPDTASDLPRDRIRKDSYGEEASQTPARHEG